jgi:hypothetical protein
MPQPEGIMQSCSPPHHATTGAQTSPSALPNNQFNIYGGGEGKNKAGIGEYYNHWSTATRVALAKKAQQNGLLTL